MQLPLPLATLQQQPRQAAKQVNKRQNKAVAGPQQPTQQLAVAQPHTAAAQHRSVKQVNKLAGKGAVAAERSQLRLPILIQLLEQGILHGPVLQLGSSRPQKRFKLARQLHLVQHPAQAPAGLPSPAGASGWAALLAVAVGVVGVTRLAVEAVAQRSRARR